MSEDFIALTTDDFKLAFCQATNALCTDVQRLIWQKAIVTEPKCPPAPRKPSAALRHLLKKITSGPEGEYSAPGPEASW